MTPLKLAPLSASEMASPRLCSNHSPTMLVMAPTLMFVHPSAMTRYTANNCQGSVMQGKAAAAAANAALPVRTQARTPKRQMASLMKMTSTALRR